MSRSSEGGFARTIRITFMLVLIALLAVFAYQNTATVELKFLDWMVESRRIVVIGASFLVGLLVGMMAK